LGAGILEVVVLFHLFVMINHTMTRRRGEVSATLCSLRVGTPRRSDTIKNE